MDRANFMVLLVGEERKEQGLSVENVAFGNSYGPIRCYEAESSAVQGFTSMIQSIKCTR